VVKRRFVTSEKRLRNLINKGVEIIDPASIYLGAEVDLGRIEPAVRICPGCRIAGKRTFVGRGTKLGQDGPVAIEDCAVGNDVELRSGSFKGSVFLDRSSVGPGAQVREDCLLEEEARCGHAVGLKQTILFPFVTLGSLVNFCDCLMAGGTSRENHSEVGSSFIHFNFTPNQDKATPSLVGDVPRGVMLNQKPIFLGGQGGLVGPASVGFGSVTAAGIIIRADVGEDVLVTGVRQEAREVPYRAGLYPEIRRNVQNNITYIANLFALRSWYADVRALFLNPVILQEALGVLNESLTERIMRLKALAEKMPESVKQLTGLGKAGIPKVARQESEFHSAWPKIEAYLRALKESRGEGSRSEKEGRETTIQNPVDEKRRDIFLGRMIKRTGQNYLRSIQELDAEAELKGTGWLASIIRAIEQTVLSFLPSFR
jgi:bifunctional UDP-N-acetylglucosamine pyrophosphorylase/glucosamine-1-phosphate N-acetyltransferase